MQRREARWPGLSLIRELAAIEQVFEQGTPPARLAALCQMAAVVATIPPGEVQDQAEDRLAALIAVAMLEEEALRHVLALRRHGIAAEAHPSLPAMRRGTDQPETWG